MTLAIVALAACGSDDGDGSSATTSAAGAPATSPATGAPGTEEVEISATVGVDTSPDRVEEVPLGATVRLVLTNPDGHDEFHVHGYDLGDGEEVEQGVAKTFIFTADQAGDFEVESHTTETVLLIVEQ